MSELSLATRRLLRLCHIIQKDDANSLQEILADLDPANRQLPLNLMFEAFSMRRSAIVQSVFGVLLAWLSDIDVPDRDGVYPLAASLAGGEQAVCDLLEQHCVIVGEVPKTRADGYPRFHSFVDTVVPRYPVYPRSNPQSPSCCSVGYSVPSEATINAIRRELQRILEQPEHLECLSEQRRRLRHLFAKYPDIDPDLIQREYQQAFDVEFWTTSSATTVPIVEAPITLVNWSTVDAIPLVSHFLLSPKLWCFVSTTSLRDSLTLVPIQTSAYSSTMSANRCSVCAVLGFLSGIRLRPHCLVLPQCL
ncbi:MAG: hypothetical protein IPI24_00045 [Ignavibacteria bacterium]|nr:hypothetical protein [Ignavibacteria bacterium]